MRRHQGSALRSLLLLLCAVIGLGLTSCGKKGAPEAPGPGDRITYPRSYPTE